MSYFSNDGHKFGCGLMTFAAVLFIVFMIASIDIGPVEGTTMWAIFFIGLYVANKFQKKNGNQSNLKEKELERKREEEKRKEQEQERIRKQNVFSPKIPHQQTKLVIDKKLDITNQLTTVIKTDIKQTINNESKIKPETIKKVIEPKPQITNRQENISVKVIETIQPEKEEHSKEKYIGYNPINIFLQTEPLTYPYVLMPKPNSVIKFPRKGRSGRKGYKEEKFKLYIEKYFKNDYQIFDDRFILIKDSAKPFEPDFTLIDEKNGINIFLDVEIDEPYEGLNDIPKRKPTHYQQSDVNRNNAFKNRGWIVIRFAEIQIHQEPDSCCKFIADVLKSVNPKYVLSDTLKKLKKINPLPQWTKEEAEKWSMEKYREKYLGIDSFGLTISEVEQLGIEETELGDKIEKQVEDDIFIPVETKIKIPIVKLDKIYSAINSSNLTSISKKKPFQYDYQDVFFDSLVFSEYVDTRDGNQYRTIKVGNQTWFADNLRYSIENSWSYDNNSDNDSIYGRLYNINALKSAIPEGWHLPSDEEWKQLELYFGMDKTDVESKGWRSNLKNDLFLNFFSLRCNNSKDKVVFAGSYGTMFTSINQSSYFWTNSFENDKAWIRIITKDFNKINRSLGDKEKAISIRCMKN